MAAAYGGYAVYAAAPLPPSAGAPAITGAAAALADAAQAGETQARMETIAAHVARNGDAFLQTVVAKQGHNAEYAFLNPWSPLHAQFQDALRHAKAQAASTQPYRY